MSALVWLYRGVLAVLLCASLSGCTPSGQGLSDEENEAHYLAGKSCINSMDYNGAIAEFEKALEVNPNSAAAHFQLGWLYEREPDPAAAIYHYQEYLKLRPNADNAEVIKQHITNCKQDLAKTVLPLPVAPGMQHQFEQLAEENKRLREQLDQWKTYATQLLATNQQLLAQQAVRPVPSAQVSTPAPQPVSTQRAAVASAQPPIADETRTCVVAAGDSLYGISKKYGVKLDKLIAANPGLDPRRLRIGQTVKIPVR